MILGLTGGRLAVALNPLGYEALLFSNMNTAAIA